MSKKPEIFLQFAGKEFNTEDLLQSAKSAYGSDKEKAVVKDIKLYVKPEENAAYYVVNENEKGSIAI